MAGLPEGSWRRGALTPPGRNFCDQQGFQEFAAESVDLSTVPDDLAPRDGC